MNLHRTTTCRRRLAGFTLIELMIAVVVLAIIVALALPSFLGSIRKGRRAEAFSALAAIQQAQERYRGNNPTYATTSELAAASPGAVVSPTRPGGYYTVSVASNTTTGYVVTADGSASSQAGDATCAKLSVEISGGSIKYASCKSCSTFTYATRDACWN